MPVTVDGAPTHVLVVHVVVVLLPAAVLGSLALVAAPRLRRPFALLVVAVALLGCLAVPLAFLTGSALRSRLQPSPLIATHVALAHELAPLAAVFGLSLAEFVAVDLLRRSEQGRLNDLEARVFTGVPALARYASAHRLGAAWRISAAVLVVLAVLTGGQVYRVGAAGARAAWVGRLSTPAVAGR